MRTDNTNPYVGLRPFDVDESILFFGRNDQTLELLQRLHQHHFVAVVGSSGCGKSSLLRAGLIPSLKAGYLVDDSDHWFIAIMKPGQSPLYNLVEAILYQLNPETDSSSVSSLVLKIKEEGADALLDLLTPIEREKNINFFLLVDQFEELFRFAMEKKEVAKKDEAIDFVNIMLELVQQSVIPFYVVITMRSDFIGDCAQFYGLPEALNQSLYLVPRLNRVQLKTVIEGPAKLYGGKIDPSLTSLLLNELGKVKDELPLLQHALMRIWDFEENVNKSGALDLEDYKSIGGLEKALSNHADEALKGMSEEELTITKELFQALTSIDENGRKIRRPVLFSYLKELSEGTEEQLLNVIDCFIKDKRSFLIFGQAGDKGDKVIDISHESLIRQWDTLSKWVDEEGEAAANYLQLVEASKLQKKGKRDFLTGSELQLALKWRNEFNPIAIWANRYKEGFEECMAYLKTSEEEQTRLFNIEKRKEKEKIISLISIIILLFIMTVGGVLLWRRSENSEDYRYKAWKKLDNLVNTFYFYDDKFAIASKKGGYYFMDKEGIIVEKLGTSWLSAEPFDVNGFARVTDEDTMEYLLDTTGVQYKLACNMNQIGSLSWAVDFSNQYSKELQLPDTLFKVTELKVLYLINNQIEHLSPKIGELKNLTALILENNLMQNLPKELQELKELTILDLSHNFLNNVPNEINELEKLIELDLSVNQLDVLPKKMGNLKNLKTLDISNNFLTSLPEEIFQLKDLTSFKLRENQLNSLPNGIGKLKNLKILDISTNSLVSLPNEIGELENLRVLDLSENQLNGLPIEIGKLTNLTTLFLTTDTLTSLPQEIGELRNLKTLDISDNFLTSLPQEIGKLKNLTNLNLRYNELNSLPKRIGQLKFLRALDLGNNQLNALPHEIGKLTILGTLYLNDNLLTYLPKEIGDMENLTTLDLSHNQLTSLPKEIGKLKNLTTLLLKKNKLSGLPKEIEGMKNLTKFILEDNPLKGLPKEIGELENLIVLNLVDDSLINVLPKEIGKLEKLTTLYLKNTSLTSLPKEIGNLINLTTLDLTKNSLSSLPMEIGRLRNLTTLNLSRNLFQSLPKEICDLKNLTKLVFTGNQITSLPKEIGKLKNLSRLNLNGNQLTSLPKEIGELKNLEELYLDDNQFTNLPKEIEALKKLKKLQIINTQIPLSEIEELKLLLPNCEIITIKKLTKPVNNY